MFVPENPSERDTEADQDTIQGKRFVEFELSFCFVRTLLCQTFTQGGHLADLFNHHKDQWIQDTHRRRASFTLTRTQTAGKFSCLLNLIRF